MKPNFVVSGVLAAVAFGCGGAGGRDARAQDLRLTMVTPTSTAETVWATTAQGDPSRLFVLSRTGNIRVVNLRQPGSAAATVLTLSPGNGANGVTGLALHPDFLNNGYFYVFRDSYVNTPLGINAMTILRYRMVGDPRTSTTADPASLAVVMAFQGEGGFGQHTGGWIGFGRDGMLWVTVGDGHDETQVQNASRLRGKLLRIDVDGDDNVPGTVDDDDFPADATKNYAIPEDNPFFGSTTARPEQWATGFRNPFRAGFDLVTGDLWIGDVGETRREEVDRIPMPATGTLPGDPQYSGGRNYGWPCMEGTFRRTTGIPACATGTEPPVLEYRCGFPSPPGSVCVPVSGNSVVGAVVYHGRAMPGLRERLFFADYSTGVFSALPTNPPSDFRSHPLGFASRYVILADGAGEMYVGGPTGLFRIEPLLVQTMDCDNNGVSDAYQIAIDPLLDGINDGRIDGCACPADFDHSGRLDPDDLADYVAAFFAVPGDYRSDYDSDGAITSDDMASYITDFFNGC